MTQPGTRSAAQLAKLRTDAFARFLARRHAFQERAGEIKAALETSNKEMARLAEKFHWGSLP